MQLTIDNSGFVLNKIHLFEPSVTSTEHKGPNPNTNPVQNLLILVVDIHWN